MRRLALFISLALLALPSMAFARAIEDSPRIPARIDYGTGKAGAIEGEWVLAVDSAGSARDVSAALRAAGAVVRRISGDRRALQFSTKGDPDVVLQTLARHEAVRWIEPLYRRQAFFVPTDPSYPDQWGLPKVGAPAAWDKTRGLRSVVIAVVDTGVKLTHPDVAPHIDTENDRDFVNRDDIADDDAGHGTHVAGIAAALINGQYGVGLAPECTILPVKVLDQNGAGSAFDVAEGIKWAANSGADVINLSLGGDFSTEERDAVAYAQSKNVVVVAAAGNDGSTRVNYPAGYDGVIGVGATESNDVRASFSNYNWSVDIAAPGEGITSITKEGPVIAWSGTSMATPFVSAAAALVRTALPDAVPSEVASQLSTTATDLGPLGRDDYYGHGRLDVASALADLPTHHLDDNIPGNFPPVSPLSGTFDADDDLAAVYRFTLGLKDSVTATLTGAAGTEYDLYVYGPTAMDINSSGHLVSSTLAGSGESVTWKAPVAGEYYVAVKRTSGSGDYELAYEKTPARADLRSTSVSGPTSMYTGGVVTVADTVMNEGDISATGFYVGYYLSSDQTITTADTYLGRRYVSSLSAGQSSSAYLSVAMPSTEGVEGVYYFGAIADYSSVVAESDETDNAKAGNGITLFVNHVPVSMTRTEVVTEDVAKALNLLAGVTDADGNTLSVQVLSLPAHGTLQYASNGAATYTSHANYNGPDSLTYRVYDGYQYSSEAVITLSVAPVNDAPVVTGTGDVTVSEDFGAVSLQWASALNAGAPNESHQVMSIETTCSNPALFSAVPVLTADGKLAFTSAVNANGSSELTVTVTDDASAGGAALSTTRTFSINVLPVADATSIALTSRSTTLAWYGSSYRLAGVLKFGTVPTGGKKVILQQASSAAGPFSDTSYSSTTTADGKFVMPAVVPRNKTYYRARFAGETNESKSCTSAAVYVIPRAWVTNPVAPWLMYRTRYHSVYGYIKPRHVLGSYPVRIYAYRYVSGTYRYYTYYKARAYAADYLKSKYIASIRLPYAGKWRLRAYAPADAWHAAAWSSGYDYVTVK